MFVAPLFLAVQLATPAGLESSFLEAQNLRRLSTPESLSGAVRLLETILLDPSLTPLTRSRIQLNLCSTYLESGNSDQARSCASSLTLPDSALPSDRAALLHVQAVAARAAHQLGRSHRLLQEAIPLVAGTADEIPPLNSAIAFHLEDFNLNQAEILTLRLQSLLLQQPAHHPLRAAPALYLAQICFGRNQFKAAVRHFSLYQAQVGSHLPAAVQQFACQLAEAAANRQTRRQCQALPPSRDSSWVALKQLEQQRRKAR